MIAVVPCGVSMMDPNGRFVFVNEALAEGLGYHVSELLGRHWIESVFLDDREAVLEAIDEVTAMGRSQVQCRVVHRNGRKTAVELVFTTRKGANNTDSGLFCFCRTLDLAAPAAL